MAQRETITLVCDLCGKAEGDGVATHEVHVDRKARTFEACGRCWGKVEKVLVPVIEKGRKQRKAPRH